MENLQAAAPALSPQRVGPYRIERQLAVGGMGAVFRAHDERLGRTVAIKQILPDRAGNAIARERFRREARAVARLSHRAIVQIYDILEQEDGDWIVMEFVDGQPLADMVDEGPLVADKAVDLARQIVSGLAEAHAKGIVHRDLKAENVIVTPKGQAKILDFGLAKQLVSEETLASISADGVLIGTCRAMAPEQARAMPVDHRTDFFALGVLLYEMLTGSSPFLGQSTFETLSRVVAHRQMPVRERNPRVSERLSRFVDLLLEKEPARRPEDATAVLKGLAGLSGRESDDLTSPGLPRPRMPTLRPAGPAPSRSAAASSSQPGLNLPGDTIVVRTLLCLEMVEQPALIEAIGENRAFGITARHDHLVRSLVKELSGYEVDKAEGFTLLFERPVDAVACALRYHQVLAELSAELDLTVKGRVGIHVGEVFLRKNAPEMVARGAKPVQVEGLARPTAARLLSLSRPGQTLLTQAACGLARQASSDGWAGAEAPRWMDHGIYRFRRAGEELHVFEVGRARVAPFSAPQSTPEARRHTRRLLSAVAFLLLLAIAGLALYFVSRGGFGTAAGSRRPAVAVLGFQNLSQQPEADWLSTALSELISTEMAAGGALRLIPGESIARMKRDLALAEKETLAEDTLRRVREHLGTDYVAVGSYLIVGSGEERQLRLSLKLQDTRQGETITAHPQVGREDELLELVSRAAAVLREELGVGALAAGEAQAVRAAVPANPAAVRLYAEGLQKLRQLDPLSAQTLLEKAVEADPRSARAHAALSEAWASLGYDAQARDSANRAFELSAGLPREEQLLIQGRYYEAAADWERALEAYSVLWGFFADSVDHGVRLAEVQIKAGRSRQALETVAALRRLPAPSGDDPRIDLVEADAARTLTDVDRMLEAANRALEKGRAQGSRTLVAEARWMQATVLAPIGELEAAEESRQEALQLFAALGDRGRVAQVLNNQAIQLHKQGDLAGAEEIYREGLAIHQETGNRSWVSTTLNNLSRVIAERGDLATSLRMLEESLVIAREIRNPHAVARRLGNMGDIVLAQGNLAAARRLALQGREAWEEIGRRKGIARSHFLLGRIALAAGELEAARQDLATALAEWREIGDVSWEAMALQELGTLQLAAGELAAAEASFDACRALRMSLGEQQRLLRTDLARADLQLAQGHAAAAEALAQHVARDLATGIEDDVVLTKAVLARALLAVGKITAAREVFAGAAARAAESQRPVVRLTVELTAARLAAADGEGDAVRHMLEEALSEASTLGLVEFRLAAQLALGELGLAAASHQPHLAAKARADLAVLRQEAEAKGFGLIARQARAAMPY